MSTAAATRFTTGHVGLNVSDLARSKRFYQEVFGFEVLAESAGSSRPGIRLPGARQDHRAHPLGLRVEAGSLPIGPDCITSPFRWSRSLGSGQRSSG